ncbi:hypothetical protein GGG16DRAFT_123856 [Schizophyllum commune]
MPPDIAGPACFHWKCVLTGSTSDLELVRLIHGRVATDGDQHQLANSFKARMEWTWGLPRGGLAYYLTSPRNAIILRSDMADMLCHGHFVLFPTFKTYMDAVEFSECVGISDREDSDRTPRRPLTALLPPNRPYRYIFFPLTDTGRQLRSRLRLPSQTAEDCNWGVHPITGKRLDERAKSYPIVETPSHPVSVCTHANNFFRYVDHRADAGALRPWRQCLARFLAQWGIGDSSHIEPPRWFLDDDEKHWDDESLCSSEATGYLPLPESDADHRPPKYVSSGSTDDSHYSARVSSWLDEVVVIEARPSKIPRLASSSMKGFRIAQLVAAPAQPKGDYNNSPYRRARESAMQRRDSPAWVQRAHEVPSETFTSNDWAMFYYRVSLEATCVPQHQTYAPRLSRFSR